MPTNLGSRQRSHASDVSVPVHLQHEADMGGAKQQHYHDSHLLFGSEAQSLQVIGQTLNPKYSHFV